jgi:hypothetical protein
LELQLRQQREQWKRQKDVAKAIGWVLDRIVSEDEEQDDDWRTQVLFSRSTPEMPSPSASTMKRIEIGEAILVHGESLVEEYIDVLRRVMRDPKAEVSPQEREDWEDSIDAFRRLSSDEQVVVLRDAERRLKRFKARRTPRHSD